MRSLPADNHAGTLFFHFPRMAKIKRKLSYKKIIRLGQRMDVGDNASSSNRKFDFVREVALFVSCQAIRAVRCMGAKALDIVEKYATERLPGVRVIDRKI